MERVNGILQDWEFRQHCGEIARLERERIFCRHDMTHFLDVARLAWIFNLEEGLGISREMIYGAALLHDIGRDVQYREGVPHPEESARLAPDILKRCGFDQRETEEICQAIGQHGNPEIKNEKDLRGLLYRADKASRSCFACPAQELCDWSPEKKNLEIRY